MPNREGQCPRCGTSNPDHFAKRAYYCRACNAELRKERIAREEADPLSDEIRFQRQLRRLSR